MTHCVSVQASQDEKLELTSDAKVALGNVFVNALQAKDFDGLERLFSAEVRFRAMVPSGERVGKTAGEAAGWLRRWFGDKEMLQVLQSASMPMADRLYLNYRLRLYTAKEGWQVIEQHAYCVVESGRMADMWLVCSGFRPDPESRRYPLAALSNHSRA